MKEATAGSPQRYGFDLLDWLDRSLDPENNDDGIPPSEYLNSAPISYPLIFLCQIAKYLEALGALRTCHEAALGSGWLRGASGHSQGIVAAVALAASRDTESLKGLSLSLLKYMLWHGLRSQAVIGFELRKDKDISPMLFVKGVSRGQLEGAIAKTRSALQKLLFIQEELGVTRLKDADTILEMHVSLVNGYNDFVVSGHPKGLVSLREMLQKMSAKRGESQARLPFSQRKPLVESGFLDVSAAFHCSINDSIVEALMGDVGRLGLELSSSMLQVPVWSTCDGADLRDLDAGAPLMRALIRLQLLEVNDLLATARGVHESNLCSHVVYLGPGAGISRKLLRIVQGTGLQVVDVDTPPYTAPEGDVADDGSVSVPRDAQKAGKSAMVTLDHILSVAEECESVSFGPDWGAAFKPRVSRRKCDGRVILNTKFSREIGKPPVLMPGMTPTTSFYGIDLVAACTNAGYAGELAAGGLPRPEIFRAKIDELVSKLEPGIGICINMLYLNSRQWSFQFPLVLELARNNYPIESITIGAGVPTPEKAEEIISGLLGAGIKYIGLKPGSVQAVREVVLLAKLNPKMTFMLQWTSGRGGGHHSFEDFHDPLLQTYAEIREQENIILVVGSGFGDARGSYPFLDGSWSLAPPYRRLARMPVDAVLFGSRCMVAKEAATAVEVKNLIVATPGIENEVEWDTSYRQSAGGVITVQSELGEPIHKLCTRGMQFWKECDEKYFSLPRGEAREEAILQDKAHIVASLNAHFQKVFFGTDGEGRAVDLEYMTYAQVVRRMIGLMHVEDGKTPLLPPSRWIHESFKTRTLSMMNRLERRFASVDTPPAQMLTLSGGLEQELEDDPRGASRKLVETYPQSETTLLADEDVNYFVELCRSGGKPVNFVPVVDGDLALWMKKDSLWYSEDLDGVQDRDPGRVCVLHGPVAARFSTAVNEPIAAILGSIHDGYVELAGSQEPPSDVVMVTVRERENLGWQDIVLKTPRVVQGKKWFANPIHALWASEKYQAVHRDEESVLELRREGKLRASIALRDAKTGELLFTVFDIDMDAKLQLTLYLRPHLSDSPLHQSPRADDEIQKVYRQLWGCGDRVSILDTFTDSVVVSAEDIKKFNRAIDYAVVSNAAPLDIATMAAWRPLVRVLFAEELQGNLLKLVHLSHSYKLACRPEARSLVGEGERIDSKAKVNSIRIQPGVGKRIQVDGTLWRYRGDEKYAWISLSSTFLIRGNFADYDATFSSREESYVVECHDFVVAGVLNSQSWLKLDRKIRVGDSVVIQLEVEERYASASRVTDVRVGGTVLREEATCTHDSNDGFVHLSRGGRVSLVELGRVEYSSQDGEVFQVNPVTQYLKSISKQTENATVFENGGYELVPGSPIVVQAPLESLSYAEASRDYNPIHRDSTMATIAELPQGQTIVHGMWSAATARKHVEHVVADGDPRRIANYQVEFVGMVFPGDSLCTTMRHVGMVGGRKLVHVFVNKLESRELVVKAVAEIEQPLTAYLFTGQGSAAVNMGMDRYDENPSARKVWDAADKYLLRSYGFSILEIVRKNPKTLTIHFGGPQGKTIRENYLRIKTEDPATKKPVPLIREIDGNTKSFTFNSPQGLLFATQFSQPALVLVQKAAFEELIEGGYVPDDAMFAGHSLGEYAALASFADVMSVEALVETVFLRGMVMQNAVPRDASGRSNYAMVAANPSRVSSSFLPEMLEEVVSAVGSQDHSPLIQIVNWNVRGYQYVVAGELIALDALSNALTMLKNSVAGETLTEEFLLRVVEKAYGMSKAKMASARQSKRPFTLSRGAATIPLPGIDVPFHSRHLLPGVPAFRQLLEPRLTQEKLSVVKGRLLGEVHPERGCRAVFDRARVHPKSG